MIATTSQVPDFLLFGGSSEDTMLFPDSATNNGGHFLTNTAGVEPQFLTDSALTQNQSEINRHANRVNALDQDYQTDSSSDDDYEFDFEDYEDFRTRQLNRRNFERIQRLRQRAKSLSNRLLSYKRKQNKERTEGSDSARRRRPVKSNIDRMKTRMKNATVGGKSISSRRNKITSGRRSRRKMKNNSITQRHSQENKSDSFIDNENPVRIKIRDKDSIEFDDYNSLEKFDDDYKFTEHDFDDYGDDDSVEQWYFDYYDYNLDKIHKMNQTNDVATAEVNKETDTAANPTVEEILAKMFNTEELLRALNATDMTNVAALLTFFNNQDLFRMTEVGKTHRQTFEKLVAELEMTDSNSDSVINASLELTNSRVPANINPLSEIVNNRNLSKEITNDEQNFKVFQPPPASDASSAAVAPSQSLSTQTVPATNQQNKNTRPKNNRQRQRNNNVLGKAVRSQVPQSLQILQPRQLVEPILSRPQSARAQKQKQKPALLENTSSPTPMIVLENSNAGNLSPNFPDIDNLSSFLSHFGKSSQVN